MMTRHDAREDLSRLDHPSRLFVEVTSRCNLRCAMCVKHSGHGVQAEGDMSPETFRALEPAFPHLDALVLNGIGEPLLHPRLEAFIQTAKQAMPSTGWVGFQTNGHLLTRARATSLFAAGLDRIFLSVDAASQELFQAVRAGGSLGHVERALAALAEARKDHPGHKLEVGAEFVVMRDNLAELPGLVSWLAARGATTLVVSHLLPFSAALVTQPVFGVNTRRAKAYYQECQDRAKAQGLALDQYFRIVWKYHKTPQEQALADFVQQMLFDAVKQDIPFQVTNIITGEDLALVEDVFRRAETVAESHGLRLVLPPVQPVSGHACLGVKKGGMFVAWDGKVSPCHFLWRSFSCYFYGREKQVAHKVFGDMTRQSLAAVWNSPAYRAFREDVMRRRYPHCPSCNVYPCEDINSLDFENDCYGETVPCGDCLWSMGLLQCMGQEDLAGEFQEDASGASEVPPWGLFRLGGQRRTQIPS
ncbi:radical SAM/SPASM domain-containing protein [Solidesulfovibrio magneticus]|nr:radical SAM/SPASM domain-containing protein [Solidesulfovibrio magneticus]